MIPRFSNPHFLPESSKATSRSELYRIDGEDTEAFFAEDPIAIARLNELLSKNFALVRHESDHVVAPATKKRKRKEPENTQETPVEEPILFRLVSSALPPIPVSLLPPPPPPPITREPDVEDSEIQARLRKERAESVSVDAEVILQDCSGALANPRSKLISMHSRVEEPSPRVMIIRTLQSLRKTRPPVPSSIVKKYPYVSDTSSLEVESSGSKTRSFFTIDAGYVNETSKGPRKTSRRRRKTAPKERPPPQFWRPSSTLTGKCRGYAYGYPSYLASSVGSLRTSYKRDSMKKGVLVNNS